MKQVYLDNNATTRLDPMVLEAMMPFLTDFYGNPSSIHDFGIPAQAALERAHQQAAALLGAEYHHQRGRTSGDAGGLRAPGAPGLPDSSHRGG